MALKDSYSVEVKPVTNGYIVEESWFYKEGEFTQHKCEKHVFTRWVEVAKFMQEHLSEAVDIQLGH